MKRRIFKKRRESIPTINSQNKIVTERAGGIKLEYDAYVTDNIRLRIGKRDIYIPYWWYTPMRLVFYKPLKKQMDVKKYKIPKNFHGKPRDIYTNLWLIACNRKGHTDCYEDVIDISKDFKSLRIKTMCSRKEHHKLIPHLNTNEERFSIPYEQILF